MSSRHRRRRARVRSTWARSVAPFARSPKRYLNLKPDLQQFLGLTAKDSSKNGAAQSLITTIKDGMAITTTRAGTHVSTVRASASHVAPLAKSAPGRVLNTPAAGAHTSSSGQPARPAAAKQPAAKSSNTSRAPATATSTAPFSKLMGGAFAPRRRSPHAPQAAPPSTIC